MITRKHTNNRMSRIVIHNQTVYLCGQVCNDRDADITIQTQQTLDKIEMLLQEVGSDKNRILSATVYIKDMDDFAAMNEVWDGWIDLDHAPARACIRAEMASPQLLVEISIVAAVID